ncbi:MAG: rhamnulokinase [Anaerolineae bacterium]
MRKLNFIAFDLGAESGRGVLGQFDGERLTLREIHRFPNGPVRLLDSIHWDVLRLFMEIKQSLGLYVQEYGAEVAGIGLDTWGVDFALLGRDGSLLGNPWHYRDKRTDGMMEEAFRRVSREEIFEYTGIQFMQLNTLYQLLSMALARSPLLEVAETLLMMPDLFNFWLTGRKVCEFTDATTTQFYDPRRGDWARPLLEKLGLPTHILKEIVPPGTELGPLLPSVAEEVGLGRVPVIAPACHDTGSAVAAVPARGQDWAYISSGTWSLMGVEVTEPVINEKTLNYNFTNEGGVEGTFRLLKNIMGLWLVQSSRQVWARAGENFSYTELTEMAAKAKPFKAIINPDDPAFIHPEDMVSEIRAFCGRTGQKVPEEKGEVIRCILESLALRYRWTLERLEELLGRRLNKIHIVGGGSQNRLLCQFTASSCGREVLTGPVEATAIGNVIMQALGQGHLASLGEARELVRRSFDVLSYEPVEGARWDEAYERFVQVAK